VRSVLDLGPRTRINCDLLDSVGIYTNLSLPFTLLTIFETIFSKFKYLSKCTPKYLTTRYFDYSCSSWYSGLGSGLTKKLQILQNKVVRFVLDLGPRTRINCSVLFTFLIEIGKLFQSLIALYEKLLVLHKFVFGVIKFKLEEYSLKYCQ
jgi:hypothetical protein